MDIDKKAVVMDYEEKARDIAERYLDAGAIALASDIANAIREAVEGEREKWDSELTRIAAEHAEKREEYTPDQWGWFTHNAGEHTIREARDIA